MLASRVIFVGMNNKPGLPPLCSTTKSGKLIDRIIKALPEGVECIKSNLFDIDHFPKTDSFNYGWCSRVGYTSDDIIVCLGACVQQSFKKSPYKFISIGHPSAVWANDKKEQYVVNAVQKIKSKVSNPLYLC